MRSPPYINTCPELQYLPLRPSSSSNEPYGPLSIAWIKHKSKQKPIPDNKKPETQTSVLNATQIRSRQVSFRIPFRLRSQQCNLPFPLYLVRPFSAGLSFKYPALKSSPSSSAHFNIMDHIDTSWCPVCAREIMPKRFLVPVAPPLPPSPAAPAPPPSSPSSARECLFPCSQRPLIF